MTAAQDTAFASICRDATTAIVEDVGPVYSVVVGAAAAFHVGVHVGLQMALGHPNEGVRLLVRLNEIAEIDPRGGAIEEVVDALIREVVT